jgi:hypothetical protein
VRNWIKDKKIASVRVQGKIKIPAEELDKVLKGSLAPKEK